MAIRKYFKKDSDIHLLNDEVVGIIGYGIQGQNQALNLRDNGINVIVSNKKDSYCQRAINDGFDVFDILDLVSNATIIMMLIPDQAQGSLFKKLEPYFKENTMLVVAHGYSLRYKKVVPPKKMDVIMLAPRFPGAVLRHNFMNGKGTLAYFDVYQNYTMNAKSKGLALANGIGFMEGDTGILGVTVNEETEIDLFIEQFLIPSFLKTIQTGFDVLSSNGYSSEVSLLELYTSGEIVGLLDEGLKVGLYSAFQENTSPTCQFGVAESFDKVIDDDIKIIAENILKDIKEGVFVKRLDDEASEGYPKLKKFNRQNLANKLSITQKNLSKIIDS